MAYAHARGVVHRDLKPSNIMVGAFGEVQVVDWGLSKVLRQGGVADERHARQSQISVIETVRSDSKTGSGSLAGSVMGTPAYMPPEQAQGDVEKLDERADVFALGAILCEILTGLPPYVGERDEALRQATEARLGGAHDRLSSCGADRVLIEICESCLRPGRSERPSNAGVLAKEVASHLAGVEKRAEEAKIAAALASEKTAGARRAQRLTLAIAASLLLALGLGTGLLWMENEREKNRGLFVSRVQAQLSDIRQLQGRAEAAPIGELEDWVQAQALLTQVAAHAESGAAGEGLRVEVLGLERSLQAGHEEAVARADAASKDAAMLRALDEAVPPTQASRHGQDADYAWLRSDLYREAFAVYGLDVMSSPVELVAEEVGSSKIVGRLVVALDDWASALRVRGDENEGRLRRIALEADRDPWRRKLRELLLEEDLEVAALQSLAAEANQEALPVVSIVLLARELAIRGGHSEAVRLLEAARFERPSNYQLATELGIVHREGPTPDLHAAQVAFSSAIAINPERAAAWYGYALVRDGLGDRESAIAATRKSIEIDSDRGYMHLHLSHLLTRGRPEVSEQDAQEAIAACRNAILLEEGIAYAHYDLGRALHAKGDLPEAIEALDHAISLDPGYFEAHYHLGFSLKDNGDLERAIEAFDRAIQLGQDQPSRHHFVVDALVMLGHIFHVQGKVDQAVEPLERAIALDPEHVPARYELAHGYTENHQWTEAIGAYREVLELDENHVEARSGLAQAHASVREWKAASDEWSKVVELQPDRESVHFHLGNAFWRAGNPEEAVRAFEKETSIDSRFQPLAWFRMGRALIDLREYERAAEACGKGFALSSSHPNWHVTPNDAGWVADVYSRLGSAFLNGFGGERDLSGAIEAYEKAIGFEPIGEDHCNLGWVYVGLGDYAQAADYFERGHALGSKQEGWSYPSASWLEDWRTVAEREEHIFALLDGRAASEDANESRLAAMVGDYQERYVASERLWRAAFAKQPALAEDLHQWNRYRAVRAAALAGCGQGQDAAELGEDARETLRLQAAEWLRGELEFLAHELDGSHLGTRDRALLELQALRGEPALAPLRDEGALEQWSELEQDDWRELWAMAAELSSRAQEPPPSKDD